MYYATSRRLHPGKDVTIAVDFNSWYFASFTGQIVGALLGDNIHEIIYRITHFVRAFKKLGVKLVFFMDGTIPDYKKATWIKRRRTDLKRLINVFLHLRCNYLFNVEAHHKLVGKNSLLIGDLLRNQLQCEVGLYSMKRLI